MKVGDTVESPALPTLPNCTVLRRLVDGAVAVVMNGPRSKEYGEAAIVFDDGSGGLHVVSHNSLEWEIVHLPPVAPPKVGDVIETGEQAKALPLGTVAVEVEDANAVSGPIIKVRKNRWLFWDELDARSRKIDNEHAVDHRILHIPAGADS